MNASNLKIFKGRKNFEPHLFSACITMSSIQWEFNRKGHHAKSHHRSTRLGSFFWKQDIILIFASEAVELKYDLGGGGGGGGGWWEFCCPWFASSFSVYIGCCVYHQQFQHLYHPRINSHEGAYTVKTFWLLQPYLGHLSCMPDVCVTRHKTSKGCFLFESKLKCSWEASLSHI